MTSEQLSTDLVPEGGHRLQVHADLAVAVLDKAFAVEDDLAASLGVSSSELVAVDLDIHSSLVVVVGRLDWGQGSTSIEGSPKYTAVR